jgi:hypothetical protein
MTSAVSPIAVNFLFWVVLAVSIVSVWMFPYVASGDGPSHLYNLHVFLRYASEPIYQRVYTTGVPRVGNLADGLLAMGLLRAGVAAQAAEKILVTICVAGLALAFRYVLRASGADYVMSSVVILPFLFNYPLEMGFWSFSLGVAALLVCVAICYREQGRWTWRSTTIFVVAVAVVYACHPIPWSIAMLAAVIIAVVRDGPDLWKSALRKRAVVQLLVPLLAFAPFTVPALLLARSTGKAEWMSYSSWRQPLWPFYTLAPLHIFPVDDVFARVLAVVLGLILALALVHAARGRTLRQGDVYLLIAAAVAVLAVAGPERVGELSFLGDRFVFIAWLFILLWLAGIISRTRYRGLLAVTLSVFAFVWFLCRFPALSRAEAELSEYVSVTTHIQPRSLICQVDLRKVKPPVDFLAHAVDLTMDKTIVNLNDYEAARTAFWTRFRPGYYIDEDDRHLSTVADLEGALTRFEARTGQSPDYLVVIDPDLSPQQALRRVLPHRWPEFDGEQVRVTRVAYLFRHHPAVFGRG